MGIKKNLWPILIAIERKENSNKITGKDYEGELSDYEKIHSFIEGI
jgi:hypothetical protein